MPSLGFEKQMWQGRMLDNGAYSPFIWGAHLNYDNFSLFPSMLSLIAFGLW